MMTSHQLLVRARQQKLKPVLVSCRKLLVQLQHIVALLNCPDAYCNKLGRHQCVKAMEPSPSAVSQNAYPFDKLQKLDSRVRILGLVRPEDV